MRMFNAEKIDNHPKFLNEIESLKDSILKLKTKNSSQIEEEKLKLFESLFNIINTNDINFSIQDYEIVNSVLKSFLSSTEIEDLIIKKMKFIAYHINTIDIWEYLLEISTSHTLEKQNSEGMTLFHYFVLWMDNFVQEEENLKLYFIEDPPEIRVKSVVKQKPLTISNSILNSSGKTTSLGTISNQSVNNHIVIMGTVGAGKSTFFRYNEDIASADLFKNKIYFKYRPVVSIEQRTDIMLKFNSFNNFQDIEMIKDLNGKTAYDLVTNENGRKLRPLSLNIQLNRRLAERLNTEKITKTMKKI